MAREGGKRWLRGLGVALMLVVVLGQALLRPIQPGRHDPVRLLEGHDEPVAVRLRGVLLGDPRLLLSTQQDGVPASASASASDSASVRPPCRVLLQVSGAHGREELSTDQPTVGRTELAFEACPELRQGWMVELRGSLRRPRPAPHPLLAGSAERLQRQGVFTQLRVKRLNVVAQPPTPILDLRRRIAERLMTQAGAERGGVLAALVLGSAVAPLPAEVRDAFRAAGLSHALAASGFHLSVLLGAVLAVGRRLGTLARLLLAGGAMLLFVVLAGPQPSVVRAVLMGAMALLALESGRRGRPLGLLVLTAAVMVLLRPGWLHAVGFQLSVAATAGLVVSAGPLEQGLKRRIPAWLAPTWSAPALAVPLAAMAWTLPLQLLHFGAVPLYAVPANLVAAPLLTPLTLGALALALIAVLVPPLLGLLLPPFQLLAGLLLGIVKGFAALPMAQWQSGRPQPVLVALLALAMLGWVIPSLRYRWRLIATALLALVMGIHLSALGADRLLLVHQQGRDLLLARHRGRGALITNRADGYGCSQASQLARGLGLGRFDWVLLLDPVAPADPACWQRQGGLVMAYGEATEGPSGSSDGTSSPRGSGSAGGLIEGPLLAGQRLASPGLEVEALSMDSHALWLRLGKRHWMLLPDRQALWAWQASREPLPERLWLGFRPGAREFRALLAQAPSLVWMSGPDSQQRLLPAGWRASGARGSLQA